jgi:hypothetical protein
VCVHMYVFSLNSCVLVSVTYCVQYRGQSRPVLK